MATCKNCGRTLILNGGKCVYCGTPADATSPQVKSGGKQVAPKSKPIVQRKSFANGPKSIQDLRIKVTSPGYDNIGQVLTQLGVNYSPFDRDYNCDILFLNCGTSDVLDPVSLRSFVDKGGILYASDLTSSTIEITWPDLMTFDNNTDSCEELAKIVDPDLRQYLGNSITVEFDLGAWSKIINMSQGKVLIQSANAGFPIMVECSIGRGKLFYTSFHNHAQTEEAEKKLLQLLVIKQVSVATNHDFGKTVQSFSL